MKGMKILIIDDTEENFEPIIDWLKPLGCLIQTANSPSSGLARIQADPPDVVILDWLMPESKDGLGVLRAIRHNDLTKSLPVVIWSVTGNDEEARITGFNHGTDHYLSKSASLAELEAVLRRALERRAVAVREEHKRESSERDRTRFSFNARSGQVSISGEKGKIQLVGLPLQLMIYLWNHRDDNEICEREAITKALYNDKASYDPVARRERLDTLVGRLREALGDNVRERPFIETVRGSGFRLDYVDIEK